MEQQQFQIRLSLGTKLLLTVVGLLVLIIFSLNLSSIYILTDDKRAYTYESQLVQADLVGHDFVSRIRTSLDTLRVVLANFRIEKPISGDEKRAIESIVNNQSLSEAVGLFELDLDKMEPKHVLSHVNSGIKNTAGATDALTSITAPLLIQGADEIKKQGFALFNLSKAGEIPVIGVVLADIGYSARDPKTEVKRVPAAVAILSLAGFGKELRNSSLTILNHEGRVFFDTNPEILFTKKWNVDHPLYLRGKESKVNNGTLEFALDGTRYLGSFVQPGLELIVFTQTEWKKAMQATYSLTEKFILLGLLLIAFSVILALFFSKTLTRPLSKLYDATREVSQGNFALDLKAGTTDEIGALTSSFNAMSVKIVEMMDEKVQLVRLENELAIASTVQQTLFPPLHFDNDFIKIRGYYQSASECGGDWWGYFGVGDKLCMMIADATGHGLPSALITAAARSCFSVMNKLAQDDPEFTYSPGSMMSYANRVIYESANGQLMMTFFIAVLDFKTHKLSYASAGHNPPWLFKKSSTKYTQKSLVSNGQRLGEAWDVPPFEEKEVDIAPGDLLFLYTDGLTEGKDANGNMYGKKQVKKIIESSLNLGPEAALKALTDDFQRHNGPKALDDDVTLSICQLWPTNA